jgi:micrococcal nuclease
VPGCLPANERVTGHVTRVYDGDTIEVNIDGKTVTVRYIGIEAPEIPYDVFAPEAATRNKNLVFGEQVTLIKDVTDMDTYGHLLRYVLVGDRFINYEMLLSGYADILSNPPNETCTNVLQLALEKAASKRIGMWATANIIRTNFAGQKSLQSVTN